MEKTDLLQAIDRAVRAEIAAAEFYQEAARKTDDPGGVAMFQELAAFEKTHQAQLENLKASLASGRGAPEYPGKSFTKTPRAEAAGRKVVGDHADTLEALSLAIAAEERAESEYQALAEAAPDHSGAQLFRKLAEEESMHRRLLDDQYYALTNRGVWLWGD